jgi:hypothetical protein
MHRHEGPVEEARGPSLQWAPGQHLASRPPGPGWLMAVTGTSVMVLGCSHWQYLAGLTPAGESGRVPLRAA